MTAVAVIVVPPMAMSVALFIPVSVPGTVFVSGFIAMAVAF